MVRSERLARFSTLTRFVFCVQLIPRKRYELFGLFCDHFSATLSLHSVPVRNPNDAAHKNSNIDIDNFDDDRNDAAACSVAKLDGDINNRDISVV